MSIVAASVLSDLLPEHMLPYVLQLFNSHRLYQEIGSPTGDVLHNYARITVRRHYWLTNMYAKLSDYTLYNTIASKLNWNS